MTLLRLQGGDTFPGWHSSMHSGACRQRPKMRQFRRHARKEEGTRPALAPPRRASDGAGRDQLPDAGGYLSGRTRRTTEEGIAWRTASRAIPDRDPRRTMTAA